MLAFLYVVEHENADSVSFQLDAICCFAIKHRNIEIITSSQLVSDIAIFVLKRDIELQPTNQLSGHLRHPPSPIFTPYAFPAATLPLGTGTKYANLHTGRCGFLSLA